MDKNIEHQTFESVSVIVQKKFQKQDFLSGMYERIVSPLIIYLIPDKYSSQQWVHY